MLAATTRAWFEGSLFRTAVNGAQGHLFLMVSTTIIAWKRRLLNDGHIYGRPTRLPRRRNAHEHDKMEAHADVDQLGNRQHEHSARQLVRIYICHACDLAAALR